MKHHYNDIRSRVSETPKWHDEFGVPRYCDFSPEESGQPYASEVVLLQIACQECGKLFNVCLSKDAMDFLDDTKTLAEHIEDKSIHYGDPPNVNCCSAGYTMNSIPRRVLEYWVQEGFEWGRDSRHEIVIEEE